MLRSLKSLEHYKISATDGELGKAVNFLLDDERWIIRYLVVETGGPLGGRRVLISPASFREADRSTRQFHLALTMDKVKNSPEIDVDKPVSRQYEHDYLRYYGYASYWGMPGPLGLGAFPSFVMGRAGDARAASHSDAPRGDVHLRSAEEIRGYHVQGSDEAIGHVEDFIIEDDTWAVRYLVINTRNWWFGKKVLMATHWAGFISFANRTIDVALSRQEIKSSPEWDPDTVVGRDYEMRLHGHYGRRPYWVSDPPAETPESSQLHRRT